MAIGRHGARGEVRPAEAAQEATDSIQPRPPLGVKTRKPSSEERGLTGRPDKLFAKAVKLLAVRPRSESDIRDRLAALADENAVDACLLRLKELGFIDDARFAMSYASHRLSTKLVGRSGLARELAAKRVSRSAIDAALNAVFNELDERVLIDRAIEKRMRRQTRPLDRNGIKRLFDHLARLGFDRELIITKVRALKADTDALDSL